MRAILVLFVGVGISLGLGLWSAWLAVRSPSPIDAITLGPWQAWPNAGTEDVDPYSRARLARTGEIPLGSGEGLTLTQPYEGKVSMKTLDDRVRDVLSGNICRCTGYISIVEAVLDARAAYKKPSQ